MSDQLKQLKTNTGKETGLLNPHDNTKPVYSEKELLSMLEGIEEKKTAPRIDESYWECENVGDKIRGVFLGYKVVQRINESTGELEPMSSVRIQTKDRGVLMLSQTMILETFLSYNGSPQVEIELIGQKKAKVGKMKIFAVRPLM